jgi:signal transduction histidine kinase
MLIDLLEISRMTAAENVEVEPVDVARMLTQILQQHGVDLAIMVGERPVVRTDGRHLERVFDNIVRNAESHGAGLRCVEILSDSHAVTVRIRDSGPGIDEELAKRLFEPFVRGDQADPTSGAGLGMAIALEHAGVIHAGLEVGRAEEGGAQFVVSVPWEISA